ncbi:MAG TPA: c-type cytochrome [Pyrinomonadaceae bacterium]|nr:c-type cytochrome [Pyrinomonadaceae bacterium]
MSRHLIRNICIAVTLLSLPLLLANAQRTTRPVDSAPAWATTHWQPRTDSHANVTNAAAAAVSPHQAQTAAAQVRTAEQRYKNIQVFKGMPASELQSAMTFIASSLGVNCNYCHVGGGAFEKDDKPTKQTARRMIQMMRNINDTNFGGQTVVTCNTCHRGSPRPAAIPALTVAPAGAAPPSAAAANATPEAPLPTVEQVLDKYVEAIGGKAALAALTTRHVKGSRVNADGTVVPTEIYQKAPDKIFTAVNYPNFSFYSAFNGAEGWAQDSRGSGEITKELLALTKRDAEFFFGARLAQLYTNLKLAGKQKVGEQEAYVVNATTPEGTTETLFFDTATGLLIQRRLEVKSVLGSYPFQIRYDDYRQVDGVRLPFSLHWSRPGIQWSRKLTEVKHNVAVEDAKFDTPPSPASPPSKN